MVPTEDFSSIPTTYTPSIFVNGADYVQIWNLTIVPDPARGYGELAIAVNQSDYAYIRGNDIQNFANGLFAQDAAHIFVTRNTADGVISDGAPIVISTGFLHCAGANATYVRNSANDYGYGQFHCDANGLMCQNVGTNCSINSLTLCKTQFFSQFPNGDTIGADISATNWLVINNRADNCANGYDVFDGSNNNLLISNEATNSGVYDVQFTGDVQDPFFACYLPSSTTPTSAVASLGNWSRTAVSIPASPGPICRSCSRSLSIRSSKTPVSPADQVGGGPLSELL